MTETYPSIEPYEQGWLDVGDGHRIHWETSGDHHGKPAVVVHGGPGSGCTPWHRRLFDPARYRIVLFDQRGCGRSTPHASEAGTDLSTNTTQHLVADMDRLRAHLGIDRWLVLGGSWGSTLSLAYAETHPDRVSELVLWGVTTGRRSEADWLFRGGVAPLFPAQWEQLRAGVPEAARDDDVVEAYARRLHDPDPEVREQAVLAWCTWESATPDWPPTEGLASRFRDPAFALGFARLVTHYVAHDLFLEDGVLLRDADRLADPRRARPRPLRPAGAARQRVGAASRLALGRARDRRGRPRRRRRRDRPRARPRHRPLRHGALTDARSSTPVDRREDVNVD